MQYISVTSSLPLAANSMQTNILPVASSPATDNAYCASTKDSNANNAQQLSQLTEQGEALLGEIAGIVKQMQAGQTQNGQIEESSGSAEKFSYLSTLIEQLDTVFAQFPAISQKLSRAHALLMAQREASQDGILVVDENDRILSINQRFCEFWNIPPDLADEKDDRKLLSFAIGQTVDPEALLAKVQHLYQNPTESSHDEIYFKDGRIGDRYSAPVISYDGEYFGRVWYFRDITHRKQQEQAQQQLNETLETQVQQRTLALQESMKTIKATQTQLVQSEKMVALGNLVAGVAHEINNPVGFIAGNVNPALDYIKDLFELIDFYQESGVQNSKAIAERIEDIELDYIREDLPKLLSSIKTGANRIREISTSLRTFSRADTDAPVSFNIHNGIDSTLLILKHRLKAAGQRPDIKINKQYGSLPTIECYAGQLNQVFMNLLANAIDALEEGCAKAETSTEPCITIRTELLNKPTAAIAQITIQDNGTGIDSDTQQQMFEHLFTTKPVGKGTGLGLAIVRQIIKEKHNGDIYVESTPGVGTSFVVMLPVNAHKKQQNLP